MYFQPLRKSNKPKGGSSGEKERNVWSKHLFKLQSYFALAEIHTGQLKEEPHSTTCKKQWWTYSKWKLSQEWGFEFLNNLPKLHGYRKTANSIHKHQPTLVQDTATKQNNLNKSNKWIQMAHVWEAPVKQLAHPGETPLKQGKGHP